MRSPTNTSKVINYDDTINNSIDDEFALMILKFFDSEVSEICDLESQLAKLKSIEQLKVPFTSSGSPKTNIGNSKSLSKAKDQNNIVGKKYLNSVTIDLVMSGNDRSKSKKGK